MRKLLLGLIALLVIGAPIALAAPAQAVSDTAPSVSRFNATDEFFPTVRDGYKDSVTFNGSAAKVEYLVEDEWGDYWETANQDWNITVRNSNGGKIWEKDGNDPTYGGVWATGTARTSAPTSSSAPARTRPR